MVVKTMLNPIKFYRNLKLRKLKAEIIEYSDLIYNCFWLHDVGMNCNDFHLNGYFYETDNYIFENRYFIEELRNIWIITPKTVQNNISLSLARHHHGLHPHDWIVKFDPYIISLPPERLRDKIYEELKISILAMPKNPEIFKVKKEVIESEVIDNRFDILDL